MNLGKVRSSLRSLQGQHAHSHMDAQIAAPYQNVQRPSVRLQRCLSNTSIDKTYIDKTYTQSIREHSYNSYPNIRVYFSSTIFIFSTFYLLNDTLPEPIPQLVFVHCWVPFLLIQVGRYKVVHFLSQILISWLNKIA